MKAVLIFDADNTLWDTDSVFRSAQLSLLRTLQKFHLLSDPEEHLSTLRTIDRELFEQMGRFEYDFKVLSIALIILPISFLLKI
jgi:FMN phosphatase YigB (HAD superfamily)